MARGSQGAGGWAGRRVVVYCAIVHLPAPVIEAFIVLSAAEALLFALVEAEALRIIGRVRESNREAQLAIYKLTPREGDGAGIHNHVP
jgi:hypothetical protein